MNMNPAPLEKDFLTGPVRNIVSEDDGEIFNGVNIVTEITSRLESHGIESSRVNAEIMLSDILGCARGQLYINDIRLSHSQIKQLDEMVSRRIAREPLQYITGKVNFYGSEFLIEPGVFIPRPETEILVDTVIKLFTIYHIPYTICEPLILDLGTGSGNIAISLTKALADCKIIASDKSEKAITLAEKNSSLHGVSKKIEFIRADLFDIPERYKNSFDMIVSNPPYIAHQKLKDLSDEVRKEPLQALDGGRCGVNFYSRIIEESSLFLKNGGIIAFELEDGIYGKVKELFEASGRFHSIRAFRDLNDIIRVITAKKL